MYSILSDLDRLKAERDEYLAQQQGWMNGTQSMSHTQSKLGLDQIRMTTGMSSYHGGNKKTTQDHNDSVFSDSERFEKLVNLDFSFA
jgi:hypothetical protein